MSKLESLINKIVQNKIPFEIGCQTLLDDQAFDYATVFTQLRNYIFNNIPNKKDYNSETYKNAINTIPLKPTFTSIVILKTFSIKIAFDKLEKLPKSEQQKIIISLLWIFKETDSKRRNTACKNGCKHEWHNFE